MTITVEKVEDLETNPTVGADNLVWDSEAVNVVYNAPEERWGEPDYDFGDNPDIDLELLLYDLSTEGFLGSKV